MTMFTKAALARRVLAGLLATVATGAITATAVAEPPSVPPSRAWRGSAPTR